MHDSRKRCSLAADVALRSHRQIQAGIKILREDMPEGTVIVSLGTNLVILSTSSWCAFA